jgi:hypothetical protein
MNGRASEARLITPNSVVDNWFLLPRGLNTRIRILVGRNSLVLGLFCFGCWEDVGFPLLVTNILLISANSLAKLLLSGARSAMAVSNALTNELSVQ